MLSVWTDGLQSNLVAEFVGLTCSIIATYLIIDQLIERNRRRHFVPLRRSLHYAVGQNLVALAHLWAFTMGRANGQDLEQALGREVHEAVRDFQSRIESELARLESSEEARAAFIAQAAVEADELARETVENIGGIGDVGSRVSQVVLEDTELERMLAELTAEARRLDHVRSFGQYLANVNIDEAPLDFLVVLSIRCYRHVLAVWNYLDSPEARSA